MCLRRFTLTTEFYNKERLTEIHNVINGYSERFFFLYLNRPGDRTSFLRCPIFPCPRVRAHCSWTFPLICIFIFNVLIRRISQTIYYSLSDNGETRRYKKNNSALSGARVSTTTPSPTVTKTRYDNMITSRLVSRVFACSFPDSLRQWRESRRITILSVARFIVMHLDHVEIAKPK